MKKKIKLFLLAFLCLGTYVHAQVKITTFAGSKEAGYSNGPASAATFNRPNSVFKDKHGDIYVTDAFNCRIRKISNGIVTNYAGNGVVGYGGDDGSATDASFNIPQGMHVDAEGNIYIADVGNQRIRKICKATGIITTVAGNGVAGYNGDNISATEAQLNVPVGVFVNGNSMYIADYFNARVRKVDLTTHIITTIAGTGYSGYFGDDGQATNARMDGVMDVFCDIAGNVLAAEQNNGVVRKIDIVSGIITTIAGNGTSGYSGDDHSATQAQLHEPSGLFVDKNNNLYIADYRNGAIRRVDGESGIITTEVGGEVGDGGDEGPPKEAKLKCIDVWVDDGGGIYIADYVNQRIRYVNYSITNASSLRLFDELKISPNPTRGRFVIESTISEAVITVCNMAGQAVYQATSFATKTEIDISNQPPGMYMVDIQSGEERYVSKVVLSQ